jgi:hypothetical protein
MRILSVNPPKHVYVDLVNEQTGEVWNHVYVSKHCNNWRNIPPEAKIDMYEYSYQQGDRKIRELDGHEFYTKFCVNVGIAGAMVIYDRMVSLGSFAERPVRAGGVSVQPKRGRG